MGTLITALSPLICLKGKAGRTDRYIFPLHNIIFSDISQSGISIIQYQFILPDQPLQFLLILQQSQFCLFIRFNADRHAGDILIRSIIKNRGLKHSTGLPPFVIPVSPQVCTIFYVPFTTILLQHCIHCTDELPPVARMYTFCKLFKSIDVQSIPPYLIKSLTKTDSLLRRLVKPSISIHHLHGYGKNLGTAFKVILQFLIPTNIEQQTLATIINDILSYNGIIAATILQNNSFYPKIRLAGSKNFQICFLHALRLFTIQNVTYCFTFIGAKHPHTFFITENITKIILHIFYVYRQRYAIQNVLLQ